MTMMKERLRGFILYFLFCGSMILVVLFTYLARFPVDTFFVSSFGSFICSK